MEIRIPNDLPLLDKNTPRENPKSIMTIAESGVENLLWSSNCAFGLSLFSDRGR